MHDVIHANATPLYKNNIGGHINEKIGTGSSSVLYLENNSSMTFTLINRQGIPMVYKPPSGLHYSQNSITLYTMYEWYNNDSIRETTKLLEMALSGQSRHNGNEDQYLVLDTLTSELSRRMTIEKAHVLIGRTFSTKDFCAPHCRRYVEACDILIDSNYNKELSHHPYSFIGKAIYGSVSHSTDGQTPLNADVNTLKSLKVEVDFVDNEGKYGNKYIYFGNTVMTISPIKDLSRKDGIYKTVIMNANGTQYTDVKHHTLEESKEAIGIADKQEELLGTADMAAQLNHKLATDLANLKIEETAAKRRLLEKQGELDEIKNQFEMQKLRDDNARREIEARSHEEKMRKEQEHLYMINAIKQSAQQADAENAKYIADLKLQIEKAKVDTAKSGSEAAIQKDKLSEFDAFRDYHLKTMLAERGSYYDKVERDAGMTTTLVKNLPAFVAGVGGAIIAYNAFGPGKPSSTNFSW